jgi:ABC-type uncharacterized transport system permease subunit
MKKLILNFKNTINNDSLKYSLLAILLSFLIGIFLMIVAGQSHQIAHFFSYMFVMNFGSLPGFANFLGNLGWMIIIGLSLGVAFKSGQFNIGATGQMIFGGALGFIFASNVHIGRGGFIFTILISMTAGASVAFLIAFLKTKFNINIVVSSIMFNWIIFYLFKYLCGTDLSSQGIDFNNSLRFDGLTNLFNLSIDSSVLNIGFIIALLLVPLFIFLYKKTTWGYKQSILGKNPSVANYISLNKNWEIIKTFIISGALAGLAGSIYYCGILDRLPSNETLLDIPSQGFSGITIALIGFNSPFGILLASILLTLLNTPYIDGIVGSINISQIISASIIIMLSTVQYFIIYRDKKVIKKKIFKKGSDI